MPDRYHFARILTLSVVLLCLAAGCAKKDTAGPAQPPFTIEGIKDFAIDEVIYTYDLPLAVTYLSGPQEKVKLAVEGLPPGMSAVIKNTMGVPTFNTGITFYDTSAAAGKYNIKLVATGTASASKIQLPFTITVNEVPDCTNDLLLSSCTVRNNAVGNNVYAGSVTADPAVRRRIRFNNVDNAGLSLDAAVVCPLNELTIPRQTINGNIYYGDGFFYKGTSGIQYIQLQYNKTLPNGSSTIYTAYFMK